MTEKFIMQDLSLDDYANLVANIVSDRMGVPVKVDEKIGANDIKTKTIILNKGHGYSPVFKIQYAYESGVPAMRCVDIVCESFSKDPDKTVNTALKFNILDYSEAKNYFTFKVVNTKNSKQLLEQAAVKFEIQDLTAFVIACNDTKEADNSVASAMVTKGLLMQWGVDPETVLIDAKKNAERMYTTFSMSKFIADSTGYPECLLPNIPIFITTNHVHLFGAGIIAFPELLEKMFGGLDNLWIIPSSIHEILVMPKSLFESDFDEPEDARKYFLDMIKDVNQTDIRPDEVLSDNLYTIKDHKLEIV